MQFHFYLSIKFINFIIRTNKPLFMKKVNLTLALLLGIALSSTAQYNRSTGSDAHQLIGSILKKQETHTAAKTTSLVHERLIAQSAYGPVSDHTSGTPVFVWGISDSEAHVYNGDRTSTFDYGFMAYFHQYSPAGNRPWLLYNTAGMIDYNGITYNVFSDKYYRWMPDPNTATGGFTFIDSGTAVYNSSDKLLWYENRYQNSLYQSSRFANSYSASGNLQSSLYYRFDNMSSSWNLVEDRYYAYNTTNDLYCDSLGQDTIGVSLSYGKFTYAYSSSANQLILVNHYFRSGATWVEDARYDITYYPAGDIQKVASYDVDAAGTLTIKQIDSFGWTTGANYYTFYNSRRYDFSGLNYEETSNKHVNTANMLPDTVYSQIVNPGFGVGDTTRTVFTYNSNANPLLAITHRFNAATGAFDSLHEIRHYYYETFFPTTIQNVATAKGMVAYPNPANDNLNIVFDGLQGSGNVQLKLINTLGQVVISDEVQFSGAPVQLPLANITNGVYWLAAEDLATHKVYKQAVAKQ